MAYRLTKFQAPSSNRFRNILLTSLKGPNFQRAITPEKQNDFFFKFDQLTCQLTKFQSPSLNSF